jgi:hypothetical protein
MNKLKCKSNLQVIFDDDFNVPDMKPDIAKLIKTQGEIKFTDQKISNGKLYASGHLHFQVLYLSDETNRPVHSLQGQIPFEEIINLNDSCNQDTGTIKYEIEDMSASIINSRKLSLKALVRLCVSVEDIYDEESAISIDAEPDVQSMFKNIEVTNMAVNKKDNYRFRDEIVLPSGKSSISEILYSDIVLKNVEVRLLTNKFIAKGEFSVFLLYAGDEENRPMEYYETELPFSSTIDCNGCTEDMVPNITLDIVGKSLTVKPDSDGEERIVDIEAILELSIKVYEEDHMQILQDIYSPIRDISPIYKEAQYENLLLRNSNKCRITERIRLEDNSPRLLQISYGSGNVKVDEVLPVEGGLEASGVIDVSILYISTDDSQPLQAIRTSIPFSQVIDIKDLKPTSIYDVKANIEQINVMMLDTQEVEVKASIALNVIVFDKHTESFIVDFREAPINHAMLQDMPGMIGYIVRPCDTLWKIAKRYHTTVEAIMDINDLESDIVHPGVHLLIVKELEPQFN